MITIKVFAYEDIDTMLEPNNIHHWSMLKTGLSQTGIQCIEKKTFYNYLSTLTTLFPNTSTVNAPVIARVLCDVLLSSNVIVA